MEGKKKVGRNVGFVQYKCQVQLSISFVLGNGGNIARIYYPTSNNDITDLLVKLTHDHLAPTGNYSVFWGTYSMNLETHVEA